MPANLFQVDGKRVDTFSDFLSNENDSKWENLLYYPAKFEKENEGILHLVEKSFIEVSFKDTEFHRVSFVKCVFERCLFMGGKFVDCEFIDCTFTNTNTSKIKISSCLIDPCDFDSNFDFKVDTNIAIDLFHSIYKNSIEEHQPERAIDSLYRMKRAERFHLDSQLERKKIGLKKYIIEKIKYIIHEWISGYGLKICRVFATSVFFIIFFSYVNFIYRDSIFENGKIENPVDAFYFTCVTLTTLGFGDIAPVTYGGRLLVSIEVLIGIVIISIFLTAVAQKFMRTR